MIDTNDLLAAHEYSANNKDKLMKDQMCGCFYCLKIFSPKEIVDWIDDDVDKTALCPYCGIDAIIGNGSGFPITEEFLEKMCDYWF